MTQANQPPVREFAKGGLKVAVWEHQTQQDGQAVTRHSITWQKRYNDRSTGEWRDAKSLFPDEALFLAELLRAAWHWIAVRENQPAAAQSAA